MKCTMACTGHCALVLISDKYDLWVVFKNYNLYTFITFFLAHCKSVVLPTKQSLKKEVKKQKLI